MSFSRICSTEYYLKSKNLSEFHVKKPQREVNIKSKAGRIREIIQIKEEINEIENQTQYRIISESKPVL